MVTHTYQLGPSVWGCDKPQQKSMVPEAFVHLTSPSPVPRCSERKINLYWSFLHQQMCLMLSIFLQSINRTLHAIRQVEKDRNGWVFCLPSLSWQKPLPRDGFVLRSRWWWGQPRRSSRGMWRRTRNRLCWRVWRKRSSPSSPAGWRLLWCCLHTADRHRSLRPPQQCSKTGTN